MTRAVVLAKGDSIDSDILAQGIPGVSARMPSAPPAEEPLPLREVERRHIERVLRHTEWNKKRACELLVISRPTLDRKIEEYGLKKEA